MCDSQNNGYSCKEDSCWGVLVAIVYLFPIGESPRVPLVPCWIRCPFHMMEHDVHALKKRDSVPN